MNAASSRGGVVAPALLTRHLAIGYRAGRARCALLEDMNLTARAGELVCLLGANGSGKSTLLRTLARLQPALAGGVELAGAALAGLAHTELARRIAFVSTERVVVDAFTVRRMVELGRYAHSGWWGRVTDDDRRVVQRTLEAVGAAHLASRDFNHLSDGERQRVMIARALAQEPSLLVLDEPTAFLDVTSRVAVWGLLRDLAEERRLAILVSTHDVELALRMASVVWLITPDRRIAVGPPEDIISAAALDAAFGTRDIRFDPAERTFRFAGERLTGRQGNMRSISTMRGDGGETSLAGGIRVSKASVRVESYGAIDELNSTMGLARSVCEDQEIAALTKMIQQDLFKIGSSLATPPESAKPQVVIEHALVDRLTAEVHRLEAIEGMLADWSIAGEHTAAATYDVARTVCRRAERALVRMQDAGMGVPPAILAYLNRLSDLLWLFARKLEHDAGVSGSLRAATGKAGNRFSRAW